MPFTKIPFIKIGIMFCVVGHLNVENTSIEINAITQPAIK